MRKFFIFLSACFVTATAVSAQEVIEVDDEGVEVMPEDTVVLDDGGVDLPESMTYNVDSLLMEWHAQNYLRPDSTCENPDYNPTFAPEVYQERLQRIPAVMEFPYNSIVQRFIDQYSGRLRRSVAYMLGACNLYIPIFEEALDYYGVPLELKYLPVIESALDPTATSRVGAAGLWQFMVATGKRYGLEVNSLIDDRRDPIKSSFAAAKYLKDLYNIYGDWTLVIAAYNYGPGNVNKAMHRASAKDYWAIYPYLPKETRGYVPAFIAANYIMNYYCEHNICPMITSHPVSTDTVVVNRNLHFSQIADLCGIDYKAVKALNPQYRTGLIPGAQRPCTIRLPQETILAFVDWGDSIYNYRADSLFTRRAVVQVAEPGASSVRQAPRNGSRNNDRSASRGRRGRRDDDRSSRKAKSVTVRQGDTLSEIARRHGTSVSKLRKLNGLKGNNIRAGKKIRVK